ncbi:MAG: hypothetical protein ACON34_02035 [Flavobacteriales bacterium]
MKKQFFRALPLWASVLLLAACGSSEDEGPAVPEVTTDFNDAQSAAVGSVLKYKGQFFAIPSPIQAAILIRKTNQQYNPDLVNPLENSDMHVSRFQKALNMGVYGADLGYLSNFNNTTLNLAYFGQVQKTAEELDIKNNIDPDLLRRFAENIEQPDSLYALNADLYKAINQYLKDNEQNETASLILAGGWLEALWLSLDKAEDHAELRKRIGEQGSGLTGLVTLLEPFEDSQVQGFRDGLLALADLFTSVSVGYQYVEPITDPAAKTTYLKSSSEVVLNNETLREIRAKVTEIRNSIIL